ncbi:MAG: hypothetical protein ABFD97_07195 [Syntrophobacter sp.]
MRRESKLLPRKSFFQRKAIELIRRFEVVPDSDGQVSYRLTASGAWARSRPAHLFYFFKKINLSAFKLFVDLGSGDGAATCMAGLFTTAIGIEADPDLASEAAESARAVELGNHVNFLCADFFTQRIRAADILFIYPDKPVYALEESLGGWDGVLLVYGPHFPPKRMLLARSLKCGRESLSVYRGWKM